MTSPPTSHSEQKRYRAGQTQVVDADRWVDQVPVAADKSLRYKAVMMDRLPVLLLVEDQHIIRTALAAALEEGGYTLIEAEDGRSAVDAIINADSLSGVITDIQLGSGPTGWDVARHARHAFPGVAIVYMTGDSAADWTAEGVPNSVLLQKPFATAQVVTAVSTLLNVADVSPTQTGPSKDS